MMQVGSSWLFNPKMLNSMAALDDQTSMFSVAARDAVGSSGRIGMEYKRDKHGGRERFLEEALTLAIWGFGVRAIKQVYDAGMVGPLKGLGVKLPDLDTAMLPKDGKAIKPGEQKLTAEILQEFAKKNPNVRQYQELGNVLKETSLRRTYQISSLAKFGAASILPAAAIAFAVPTFNQWLTRNIISKEAKAKQATAPQSISTAPKNISNPHVNSVLAVKSPFTSMPQLLKQVANPWAQPGKTMNSAVTEGQPVSGFAGMLPASFTGANALMPQSPTMTAQPVGPHQPGQVRFGGMGSVANFASAFLQNEQYNTLLIDGVISGGRTYKARNPVERAEIIFREATLIIFLYFAQGHIQNLVNKGLGKAMQVPTELGFKDMQFIKKNAAGNPDFIHRYNEAADSLQQKINEKLEKTVQQQLKNGKTTRDYLGLMNSPELKTQALVDTIHEYFLRERPNGQTNLVVESSIHSGLIPTFKEGAENPKLWEQFKEIGRELNPARERNLTENHFLDLSKKINTNGIFELKDGVGKLVESAQQKAAKTAANHNEELTQMLTRVMRLRAGSLLASNIACFAALSIIFPEIQHWITYKMTGKNYFPGVQSNDAPAANKQQTPMVAAH